MRERALPFWEFKTSSASWANPSPIAGPDGAEYVAILSGVGGWAGAVISGDLDVRERDGGIGVCRRSARLEISYPQRGNALRLQPSAMNRHSPLDRLVTTTAALALSLACAGCEREERNLHAAPFQAATSAVADETRSEVRGTGSADASLLKHYESNAYAVSQGKRLFTLYNCSGCHAQGGGGQRASADGRPLDLRRGT
jgi:hypothetical protein